MAEMWNQKLTRENISDFYYETVVMVYSSVMEITKESTRAEQAIIKSYLDIYSKRANVNGEDVIYVFGDILLKNANDTVEQFPLPENVSFVPRALDEYTGNFMLEKILAKIDSKSFKMVEFMNSSDSKKSKNSSLMKKMSELFPVTPLLVFEVIIVALIIWGVSYLAITLPYKKSPLVSEQKMFEEVSLEKQYATAIDFFPLNLKNVNMKPSDTEVDPTDNVDTDTTGETTGLAPVIAETTEPQVSATKG